jgi:tetratricopeptide (TPR) repeat protein
MQKSLGPEHPDVGLVYAALAVLYLKRSAYEQAESSCQHALDILGKSSLPDYPALIVTVRTYAALLSKTNRKAQAELFETRAMTYKAEFRELSGTR